MIVTLKLWRWLKQPPVEHPLFVRVMDMTGETMPWYVAFGAVLLAPIVFPLGIMLMSDVYSLLWAVNTSGAIVQEQERGTLDLLYVLPLGACGTSWAFYTSCIHRHEMLARLNGGGVWLFRVVFILVVIDLLRGSGTTFSSFQTQDPLELVYNVTLIGAVMAATYLDHVQSIVISSLLAMLIPTYAKQRFDAQVWALIGVLLVLVTTALLAGLFGLGVYPAVGRVLGLPDWGIEVGGLVVSLLLFGILREVAIWVLWRRLVERLNADSAELDFAMLYKV